MKKYLFMLVAVFAMSTAAFAQKGITGFGVQGAYEVWYWREASVWSC